MRALAALALLALAATAAARPEHDFEFDDAPETQTTRRPRRYIYDPQNELCHALVCKKREVCLLRDSFTALCANKKDVLRRGDIIVTVASSPLERSADDEDVFYESPAPPAPPAPPLPPASLESDRCVGCAGASRAMFLCGSDNRTYSSLCRLDLHNCVHRPRPPVRLACAGFCPCEAPDAAPPAPAAPAPHSPRPPRPPRPPHPRRALRPYRPHRARPRFDEDGRRRRLETHTNEVLPERSYRRPNQEVEGCALDKMANRLLDWFSVLMEEAGGVPPPPHGFGPDCKPEVRWMFEHLDTARDGLLQPSDLYALSHDERERCLRPFLRSCGAGEEGAGGEGRAGGAGGAGVSRGAWCACLGRAARPCAALARASRPARGAYVPACDARGFYRPRQCHAALAVCWCVDPHGVERPGSRTKGAPPCPGETEDEGVPADDEDAGGSGDRDLDLRF
ncbi:proteoglycan Cow [Zerene cesonia]|uniref:proteoglycan Cow n=1 Tax=Zerene cesonia TaxID=33412 RepID=UPI0018E53FF1|nr:proteoglycan Cow [Zerene cesonia]